MHRPSVFSCTFRCTRADVYSVGSYRACVAWRVSLIAVLDGGCVMHVVGPETLGEVAGSMAGVVALGVGLGFSAHCVAYLSVVFFRFVEEGCRG